MDDKGKKTERELKGWLDNYKLMQVSVKQYCQIAEKALELPIEYLDHVYQQGSNKKPDNLNSTNLAYFLCSPNVEYSILNERNPKKKTDKQEAG